MVQWFCLISWRLFHVWTSLFGIMNQYDPAFDCKINVGHCDLLFMVQWFCLISWRLFYVWTSLFGFMNQYDLTFEIYSELYFMVHWFCIISWRLFDVWSSLFGIMNQYCPAFDLIINVGHCDLYFMVQWFCLISKTIWWMGVIFSDNETVWRKLWPQNEYRSTWHIFHGLVILLNIFKIICWMNIIVGLMDQCDTKIDLIKFMYVAFSWT